MNKFLSIFAATGLLAAFAGAAQADTGVTSVSVSGTATSVCSLAIVSAGSLAGNNANPTIISTIGGTEPTLQTTCNSGGHKIEVSLPKFTLASVDGSEIAIPGTYKVSGGFGSFNTGVYAPLGSGAFITTTPTPFTTTSTTSNTGDRFSVLAKIESPDTSLLIAGTYTASIDVKLTPQ